MFERSSIRKESTSSIMYRLAWIFLQSYSTAQTLQPVTRQKLEEVIFKYYDVLNLRLQFYTS